MKVSEARALAAQAATATVDGSRDLVERGDHREAVFWIVATYARCLTILTATPAVRD